MPCALCGSWDHNRSACPLGRAQASDDDLLDLLELGDVLDAPPAPPPAQETPCP